MASSTTHREAGLLGDCVPFISFGIPVGPDVSALCSVVIDGLRRCPPGAAVLAIDFGFDVDLNGPLGIGVGMDVIGTDLDGRATLAALDLNPFAGWRGLGPCGGTSRKRSRLLLGKGDYHVVVEHLDIVCQSGAGCGDHREARYRCECGEDLPKPTHGAFSSFPSRSSA